MRVFYRELLIVLIVVFALAIPRAHATGPEDRPFSRGGSGTDSAWRFAQSGARDVARGAKDTAHDTKKVSQNSKSKSIDTDKVWRSEDLDILGIGMGVGDLDGDGNNEVVIIGPSTVYVYRVAQGRLDLVTEYSAGSLELKSVDVAKIRKQGPCRIYVTAQNRGTVASFVLELRNRVLEPVIQDVRYYLRVINYPTRGPMLLGQRKGMTRTYDGPVFLVNDKGTELEDAGRFGVPLKIPIFGFAVGDMEGKRTPLIAVYDKEDRLRIYDPPGKRLYVSKEFYGSSDVILRAGGPEERKDAERSFGESDKAFFRPRILCMDLENRNAYDVIVLSHSSKTMRYLSRTKMLEEGRVCALAWNGDTLVEKWRSPAVQGMISDFAVDYVPGLAGRRLIILERKKTDWLSFIRSKTQVKAYDLDALIAGGGEDDRK